ncbi:tetratricopeptide repeat protein [Streptomyces sp. PTY087I2]|uniref:tetratricopeptide repeat protein n=1 Tax=Streptomyces sp. PTY087I2 TaxID=1819298 RepID=UPI00080B255F|nr:tetratricopeptide repeat protein [Streptomyces sp. PTY087I2]OCC12724.1 Regulatory protein AfsR [Streptomyces sp. PTY087I2]
MHLRGYAPTGALKPEQVLEILLRALGVRDTDLPPTGEEQAALYQSELTRRAKDHGAVLIVADDASGPGQLRSLIPAHTCHRLLSTSREALAAPDLPSRLISLDELSTESATALISTALAEVRPDDPRAEASSSALRQVANYCGRLPLALTIAAALLVDDPGLPAAVLVNELADARTRLTTLEHEDADGHTLGLRAAFKLSHQRLKKQDAKMFRLLAHNPGPDLSTEAAAALSDRTPRETRKSLASLTRAGLLSEQPIGSDRWRMHDLIHLFAYELPPGEGEEEAQGRFVTYYTINCSQANTCLIAQPLQPELTAFPHHTAAMKWLDSESQNLISLIFCAAPLYPHPILTIANSLSLYLDYRNRFREMREINAFALAISRELKDRLSEAHALNNLGNAFHKLGRHKESLDTHLQSIEIYHDLGKSIPEAQALMNIGATLTLLGCYAESIEISKKAIAIYRKFDHSYGEGQTLNNIGTALQLAGRHGEAVTAFRQAIKIHRTNGSGHDEAQALNNIGNSLHHLHQYREAIEKLSQAANSYRKYGDFHREAEALDSLGRTLESAGLHGEAVIAYTRAVEIFREFENTYAETASLERLTQARKAAEKNE